MGVRVPGFRVQSSGFKAHVSGFKFLPKVQGLGVRGLGFGFRVQNLGFEVSGLKVRIVGSGSTWRSESSRASRAAGPDEGLGFRVKVVQGYLAHKKQPPFRILEYTSVQGPILPYRGTSLTRNSLP